MITADFEAKSGDKWDAPLGMGVGKTFRVHKTPVKFSVQAYYSVINRDTFGPRWNIRASAKIVIQNPFDK